MIIGNNSDFFRNPGRKFGGLSSCQIYSCIDTGSKKNTDFFYGRLNSIPEGYGSRGWRWPTVLGSMSTYNNNPLSIVDSINNFALGNPIEASLSGNISNNNFQIALITFLNSAITSNISLTANDIVILQKIQASITGNIQVSNADIMILAAILMQAGLSGNIAFSGADLGAVFDMYGNLSAAISSVNTPTILADMSSNIGGAEPLSPQGLAQAVWNTLASNYETSTGTFGYQLAHSGSGLSAVDIANEVWNKTISALTAGQLMEFIEVMNTKIDELHKLQGLDNLNPVNISETSRTVGSISQQFTGDGITNTTITRV